MGQGAAHSPALITVGIFEPMLVPKIRGHAFVVLRVLSGDKVLHITNVDNFPSFHTIPVSSAGGFPAEAAVLELQVYTAADVHSFRQNSNVRHFATVLVPLKSFTHLHRAAQLRGSQAGAACLWLGLDEDMLPDAADVRVLFERNKVLGAELSAAKLFLTLRGVHAAAAPEEGGWSAAVVTSSCSSSGSKTPASPAQDMVKEMLVQADKLVRGLHSHVEEIRSSSGDYEALEEENARLRMSIKQQKEKYEGLTTWLRAQVDAANTEPEPVKEPPAQQPTSLDREVERSREQLKDAKDLAARLRRDLDAQYARYSSIERHALTAERAKGETLKLFGDWHQDIRWMGVKLADCDIVQDALKKQLIDLREEVSAMRAATDQTLSDYAPSSLMASRYHEEDACPDTPPGSSRREAASWAGNSVSTHVPPIQWEKAAPASNDYALSGGNGQVSPIRH